MHTPQRPIIYIRLSDARLGADPGRDRDEVISESLAGQEKLCRERAAQLAWPLDAIRVVVENDLTTGRDRSHASAFKRRKVTLADGTQVLRVIRPGWQQVTGALASGTGDGLIALDLDRAVRDPRDLEDLIDVVEASVPRIPVESVTGSLRLATDADIAMARVMVAMGNKASRDTGRRVADARARKAAAGTYGGGVRPFGYEADGVTVRPAEAAEVVRAADDLLAGVSLRAVIAGLRDRGVPAVKGGPWSSRSLRGILLRPRNAGILTHLGQEAGPAEWPAILDEETWRSVLALLTDPGRRTSPGNEPRWLLSLIARCGACALEGVDQTVYAGAGRAAQPTYICRGGRGHLRRQARPADAFVTRVILARLALPDAASLLAAAPAADTAQLAREVNALRARIGEAGDMWETGELTRAEHGVRVARLRGKLEAAESSLMAAAAGEPLAGLAGQRDAAVVWETLPVGRRRAVVRTLAEVTLLPAARRGRQPDGTYFDPESVAVKWTT